ncbi:MAG: DeoR/GlpR transcriptional regulator [Ruminococcaceae bacterium]|nr:DeoR/GlpR transcriptional regulator [Oscillospiraceae bacterium]
MKTGVEQRRNEIVEMIAQNGSVRISDICKSYGVSEVTVRSDLEYLESQGQLSRVHGGAVGTGKLYVNMDLSERYLTNATMKKELAETAASFIEDNDTIMMNSGTTLTYILHAAQGKKNVRIVTNSIQNALEISTLSGFSVVLLGGDIDAKYQFTYGNDTLNQLDKYHANKCILSVDGIHIKDGLSLYYPNESGVVRKMISASEKIIVAADSTKIGKRTFSRVANISDMNVFVTNRTEINEDIKKMRAMGIEVFGVDG